MTSSPIVTVNLWLDAGDPAHDRRVPAFFGFADGPMHWVFMKRDLVAGASHLAVVASGADDIVRADNNALTRVAFEQITQAIPEWRTRTVTRSVVVREVRATFSLAPGQPARPGTTTPLTGFFLAGDWTDTGLPGTIESAVRSGYAAADAAS